MTLLLGVAPGLAALTVLVDASALPAPHDASDEHLIEAALLASHPLNLSGSPDRFDKVRSAARTFVAHHFADQYESAEDLLGSRWLDFYMDDRLAASGIADLADLGLLNDETDSDWI